MVNDFIYCGVNGCSVIDYVLSIFDIFSYFYKFIVCNFNIYFDYVLLYIELRMGINIVLN